MLLHWAHPRALLVRVSLSRVGGVLRLLWSWLWAGAHASRHAEAATGEPLSSKPPQQPAADLDAADASLVPDDDEGDDNADTRRDSDERDSSDDSGGDSSEEAGWRAMLSEAEWLSRGSPGRHDDAKRVSSPIWDWCKIDKDS